MTGVVTTDQYRWHNQGVGRLPKKAPRIKKCYFQLDIPKGASASFIRSMHISSWTPLSHLFSILGMRKSLWSLPMETQNNPEQRTTTLSQIAAVMCCPDTSITLKVEKTQFQKGGSDCGLFAIAFATDLCHGNNPASYRYDQDKLRSHLLECLRLKKMTPFPSQLHRPGIDLKLNISECTAPVIFQMMGRKRWLLVTGVPNGTTFSVRTFQKQHLRTLEPSVFCVCNVAYYPN